MEGVDHERWKDQPLSVDVMRNVHYARYLTIAAFRVTMHESNRQGFEEQTMELLLSTWDLRRHHIFLLNSKSHAIKNSYDIFMSSSSYKQVRFASPQARLPHPDERYTLKCFSRHLARCASCVLAESECSIRCSLCLRGQGYADDCLSTYATKKAVIDYSWNGRLL